MREGVVEKEPLDWPHEALTEAQARSRNHQDRCSADSPLLVPMVVPANQLYVDQLSWWKCEISTRFGSASGSLEPHRTGASRPELATMVEATHVSRFEGADIASRSGPVVVRSSPSSTVTNSTWFVRAAEIRSHVRVKCVDDSLRVVCQALQRPFVERISRAKGVETDSLAPPIGEIGQTVTRYDPVSLKLSEFLGESHVQGRLALLAVSQHWIHVLRLRCEQSFSLSPHSVELSCVKDPPAFIAG